MTFSIEWYMQDRLMLGTIWDDLSMDEWRDISQTFTQLIRAGEAPVHIILNVVEMQKHPLNPKQIIDATSWLNEPQMGWLVIINDRPLVNMMAAIVIQAFRAKARTMDSMVNVLDFIARIDETLTEPLREMLEDHQ